MQEISIRVVCVLGAPEFISFFISYLNLVILVKFK